MIIIPTLIFILLALLVIFKSTNWKIFLISGVVLFIWFGGVVWLGKLGFFAKNPLFAPNILLAFLILFDILRRLLSSTAIKNFVESVSIPLLTVIQTYRIMGYVFFTLYQQQLLPAIFAFPAGIGDIIVGVTAPIVAIIYFLKKPYAKQTVFIWNIIGIIDLIIALGVGILVFPRPVQFIPMAISTEQFSLYPLVMIPLFAVPISLVLHLIGLRALKRSVKFN